MVFDPAFSRVKSLCLIPSCTVLRRGISGEDFCGIQAVYVVSFPLLDDVPVLACEDCLPFAILQKIAESRNINLVFPGQVLVGYLVSDYPPES